MPDRPRVAVYAEVDMNLIDGSSVWVQSICLVLAAVPADVTLLARTPARRDVLMRPLLEHPGIEIVDPGHLLGPIRRLAPEQAVEQLRRLDRKRRFDAVLIRGSGSVDAALRDGAFADRLWIYYLPGPDAAGTDEAAAVRRLVAGSAALLCQTEAIIDRVARAAPAHATNAVLLPPMIPAPVAADEPISAPGVPRSLVYAGKLSPEYAFAEMVELLAGWRRHEPTAELHVIGDKVHDPPQDHAFKQRTLRQLQDTPGLVWHGGVPRARVHDVVRSCDVALSIRHQSMDASDELSTKVLEYGAVGRPVMLNRNHVHERLLGRDYPLMVSGLDDALATLVRCAADPDALLEGARRCYAAAQQHRFDVAARRLGELLTPNSPPTIDSSSGGQRVVIAGHDLKFLGDVPDLIAASGATMHQDLWRSHTEHDERASQAAIRWADTIFCEWCLGNAVYYSHHRRDDQRLVVRLHRVEAETDYPGQLRLDRVDAFIFVAQHIMDATCERFGWTPDERFMVIPNAIDPLALDRTKLPGAEHTLAMIGYVPRRKRLDLALDLLEVLVVHDDRFRLVLKGKRPDQLPWVARDETERRFFEQQIARTERPPLRGAVSFEPFGDDVPEFLENVGWILSLADSEGHAVALAEGMASGAVPVIIDRPGALEQYAPEWVHRSTTAAADWIAAQCAGGAIQDQGARARAWAQAWTWPEIAPAWRLALGLRHAGSLLVIIGSDVELEEPQDGTEILHVGSEDDPERIATSIRGRCAAAGIDPDGVVIAAVGPRAPVALAVSAAVGVGATILDAPQLDVPSAPDATDAPLGHVIMRMADAELLPACVADLLERVERSGSIAELHRRDSKAGSVSDAMRRMRGDDFTRTYAALRALRPEPAAATVTLIERAIRRAAAAGRMHGPDGGVIADLVPPLDWPALESLTANRIHTLDPALAMTQAFELDGDGDAIKLATEVALDWIARDAQQQIAGHAWDPPVAARRTRTLAKILQLAVADGVLDRERAAPLHAAVTAHAAWLAARADDPACARALAVTAAHLPIDLRTLRWRRIAARTLDGG